MKRFKEEIKIIIFTFVCYVVTHGFAFANGLLNHDSLWEFPGSVSNINHKLSLGRSFIPIYRFFFRTQLSVPWVIGILSFIFLCMSVIAVISLLEVKKPILKYSICTIMTANITITACIGSYVHDFDANMFALLCSIVAVYLWKNNSKGYLFGALFIAVSIGIYQAFLSTSLILIVMVFLLDLLNGAKPKDLYKKILSAFLMVVAGVVAYYFANKIILYISGVNLAEGRSNSLTNAFHLTPKIVFQRCVEAYVHFGFYFINPTKSFVLTFPIVCRLTILIMALISGINLLKKRKFTLIENVIIVSIILISPLIMNLSHVLCGLSHLLMYYAFWIFYIFCLIVIFEDKSKHFQSKNNLAILLVIILFANNVISANELYLKKYQERDATLSLFTRVLYKIEDMEGYVPGETKIVFLGKPDYLLITPDEFLDASEIHGGEYTTTVGASVRRYYENYFMYILRTDAKIADSDTWDYYQDKFKENDLNVYPNKNSMKIVDNVCLVRFK